MEKSEKKFNSVTIKGSFIEKYIAYTPAEFIRVYICAKAMDDGHGVLIKDISECLKAGESSVNEAIDYWQAQGLLKEKGGRVSAAPIKDKAPKKVRFDEPPQYQPMELSLYAEKNSEVRQLFDMAQRYLGRLLTHNDLSCIFSLYHWLGLGIEVIDRLLYYCTENNHRNIRYIERVAVDWAEAGIATAEMAEERIRLYNTEFRQIMRAFGQSGRNPIPSEERFMKKWLNEFGFPVEIITVACEKTVLNTGRAVFGYADKILSKWSAAGVKTKDDIAGLELEFAEIQKEKAKASSDKKAEAGKRPIVKNKFANYEQRSYDYDAFEQMEQKHTREGE